MQILSQYEERPASTSSNCHKTLPRFSLHCSVVIDMSAVITVPFYKYKQRSANSIQSRNT